MLEKNETYHSWAPRRQRVTTVRRRQGPSQHGSAPNDGALDRAIPVPTGDVDTLFTMRDTNHIDGNRPFTEDEGGKGQSTEVTCEMIECLRNFINTDDVNNRNVDGSHLENSLPTTGWQRWTRSPRKCTRNWRSWTTAHSL